jgi:hypothetical protein
MDRRKMLALLGTSPALLAGSAVHAESPRVAGENASPVIGGDPITVLNPAIAGKLAERVPLTERLKSLDGKTIYLIDIQWGGPDAGYDLLACMQDWFAKNVPTAKTVLRRTTGNMFTDDPGLRKELIEKHADAAIVGVAG